MDNDAELGRTLVVALVVDGLVEDNEVDDVAEDKSLDVVEESVAKTIGEANLVRPPPPETVVRDDGTNRGGRHRTLAA